MFLIKSHDFSLLSYYLQVHLLLELYRLQGNMTRVKINELKPLKPRFEVPDVLIAEPPTEPWVCLWSKSAQWNSENSQTHAWFIAFLWVTSACLRFLPFPLIPLFTPFFYVFSSLSFLSKDENGVVLSLGAESQRLIVSARPFRLDIMEGPEVLLSLNSRGLLAFEHLRLRKDTWVLSFSLFLEAGKHIYTTDQNFGVGEDFNVFAHQGYIYLIKNTVIIVIL